MEPRLIAIKGGWAALGKDWAVFDETKDGAVRKFRPKFPPEKQGKARRG